MDVNQLLNQSIGNISLKILVFGPQVQSISTDERTRNLQLKRIQIREELEKLDHHVKYAEDIVDTGIEGVQGNAFLQELVIMTEYDCIITLVGSPGSIAEATVISRTPNLARKSSLFLDSEHTEGLVAGVCELAKQLGADYKTYEYPKDLVECHLLGFVKSRIEQVQLTKFLS